PRTKQGVGQAVAPGRIRRNDPHLAAVVPSPPHEGPIFAITVGIERSALAEEVVGNPALAAPDGGEPPALSGGVPGRPHERVVVPVAIRIKRSAIAETHVSQAVPPI